MRATGKMHGTPTQSDVSSTAVVLQLCLVALSLLSVQVEATLKPPLLSYYIAMTTIPCHLLRLRWARAQ